MALLHLGDILQNPMARGWLERSAKEFNDPMAQGWLEQSAIEWDTGAAQQLHESVYEPAFSDIVTKRRAAGGFPEGAQLARNAQAVRAGAFGGSRHGVLDAEAGMYHGRNLADIDATGLHRAYEIRWHRASMLTAGASYRAYSGERLSRGL